MLNFAPQPDDDVPGWASLMLAGEEALQAQRHADASSQFQKALDLAEAFDETDDRLAQSLDKLSKSLRREKQLRAAETLSRRALMLREKRLGAEHLDMATSLTELAGILCDLEQYEESEKVRYRLLKIREDALGPDHLDVALSLSIICQLYSFWHNPSVDRIALHERILAIRRQALGDDDPLTAETIKWLCFVYSEGKEYAKAEQMFNELFQIRVRALGAHHPEAAYCLIEIAGLYRVQGKYAEPLYEQISAMTYGPNDLENAEIFFQLANHFYNDHGSKESKVKAISLFENSLKIRETKLGMHDPSLLDTLDKLAFAKGMLHEHDAAARLYQRALSIQESTKGPYDLDLAWTMILCADMYSAAENFEESQRLYERVVEIFEKVQGPKSHQLAFSLANLAMVHIWRKRDDLAEPLFLRAELIIKPMQEEAGGGLLNTNVITISRIRSGLAAIYSRQGDLKKAAQYGDASKKAAADALIDLLNLKKTKG